MGRCAHRAIRPFKVTQAQAGSRPGPWLPRHHQQCLCGRPPSHPPPPRPPEHIVFCADVVINRGVRSFCLFPPGLCAAFSVRTRWSGIDGGMPYSDLARAQLPAPGRLGSGHVRLNPHRLP